MDGAILSPHRVVIFEGGHEWLSIKLAGEALEWMEIQAIKQGLRPGDDVFVDRVFAARAAEVERGANDLDARRKLKSMADDFDGLKDVTEYRSRAATLVYQKTFKGAVRKERELDQREERRTGEIAALERDLGNPAMRDA